ncbi:hypothetical protein PsorP6_006503 [Peronosclerospora sorghi]|uniref:Uncharacterized protein n=1 Tax=Peronosclerospora sorghi TaxID=230839 RepID=A0ACC0W6A6_9STRA|nr:hypothetical protein PsorP6_006503 [Peronosclerospora sorghi]
MALQLSLMKLNEFGSQIALWLPDEVTDVMIFDRTKPHQRAFYLHMCVMGCLIAKVPSTSVRTKLLKVLFPLPRKLYGKIAFPSLDDGMTTLRP